MNDTQWLKLAQMAKEDGYATQEEAMKLKHQYIQMPTTESERQAKAFQEKVKQHGPLTFVPVSQGIVDIFQGEGWGGHSRYRNYKGKWFWIAGKKLDTARFPNA